MNIAVPVGAFHRGNTSEYVVRALNKLGHSAEILSAERFAAEFLLKNFELFFCVDSGEPLNLLQPPFAGNDLRRVAYWFIDFRHHKTTRSPSDLDLVKTLSRQGGWVFQSQREDWRDCFNIERCFWLPLAADPEIWSDTPPAAKEYHLGFVGNVWDRGRARALELLLSLPNLRFAFFGHGSVWKEDGASLLRRCQAGFNISSWYGTPVAYDVNMRVFETLSCGIPLITNAVPSLTEIFPPNAPYLRTYASLNSLEETVRGALGDTKFLSSGAEAREFIVERATYEVRMQSALQCLGM